MVSFLALVVDVGAAEGRNAGAAEVSMFPESAPVEALVRCRLMCRTDWRASFLVSVDEADSVLAVGKASPQYMLRLQHFDVLVQYEHGSKRWSGIGVGEQWRFNA